MFSSADEDCGHQAEKAPGYRETEGVTCYEGKCVQFGDNFFCRPLESDFPMFVSYERSKQLPAIIIELLKLKGNSTEAYNYNGVVSQQNLSKYSFYYILFTTFLKNYIDLSSNFIS